MLRALGAHFCQEHFMRISLFVALALSAQYAAAVTVDFDDLTLPANSYFSGPMPNSTVVAGPFGPQDVGTFSSGGVAFGNTYDETFGSWSGFAYSNMTDTTTPGFTNQYSAYALAGAGKFAVATGYLDRTANETQLFAFDPNDPTQLAQLPNLALPTGYEIESLDVTNTTYAALSMLNGDSFAKKFGGPTGNDPDYFKLTVYGTDSGGHTLPNSVDFYLADFRFANNALDYIVSNWTTVNLASLSAATHLYFNLSSSDDGDFGMNTPAYFAVDNVQIARVPEPASIVLLASALLCMATFVRRKA
jgi:hypothetical protein